MIEKAALNALAKTTIDAALAVHTALGPGLLESAYQGCLAYELRKRGLLVQSQVFLPVVYDAHRLDMGYRIDLLIGGHLVVEVKATEGIHPLHKAQLLSYLKLSGNPLGLLLNFNSIHMRDGIVRMVNNF